MMAILARFLNNEDGVTAIEYALIASMIALVIITSVQTVGTRVSAVFTEVGNGTQMSAGLRPEVAVKVMTLVQ